MALIARHKAARCRSRRASPRDGAAIEVRLNATDRALSPAAGGVIVSWSDPIDGRDPRRPGHLHQEPRHRALHALPPGGRLRLEHRAAARHRRRTASRAATQSGRDPAPHDAARHRPRHQPRVPLRPRSPGSSAATRGPSRPRKFVVPYLTLVGELAQEAQAIDLDYAFQQIARRADRGGRAGEAPSTATRQVLELKETLLERPIAPAHRRAALPLGVAAAAPARLRRSRDGRVVWQRNPVEVLAETYRLLAPGRSPTARRRRTGSGTTTASCSTRRSPSTQQLARARAGRRRRGPTLDRALRGDAPAFGFDDATWARVRAAHAGHQLGLEILALLPLIADEGRLLRPARSTTT